MVADAKSGDLRETPLRFVYFNVFHSRPSGNHFVLRTAVEPAKVAADARRAARQLLPAITISDVRTLEEQVDSSIVPERIVAMLSALFGAVGSALAALGLYGLLAYTVARRIAEIGVRMALGATRAHITRMVLGEALALTVAGLAVGAPIAYWTRKLVAGLIPGPAPSVRFVVPPLGGCKGPPKKGRTTHPRGCQRLFIEFWELSEPVLVQQSI